MDPTATGTEWDPELLAVYRERYVELVRLAYLVSGDATRAEEVVQDCFVAAHVTSSRIREPAAYLRRAVVNRCYSAGRRLQLERERRPGAPEHAQLGADELSDVLGVLPDRQRAAIVLRFYLDLPDAEIARLLGCRPATVRTAVHRGLARLREEVLR